MASGQARRRRRSPSGASAESIVRIDHFIRATRDSGYKGTPSAIAELVDNSIQAGATQVRVHVLSDPETEFPITVVIQDDGSGMPKQTLVQALRFGGSTRFGDRAGTGRYGMGLPNASLSQARRLEVYTWRRPGAVVMSYLDVDEIAAGTVDRIPAPIASELPNDVPRLACRSGTTAVWRRCDRLDNKRVSTIQKKLVAFLGRVFRYPIWNGLQLLINDEVVPGLDPLLEHESSLFTGARPFGETIYYEVEGAEGAVGTISVRFAELPVESWHDLPNREKRTRGISNHPIVSVVRGDREVDRGWLFMGGKRQENYDDWWRCEIAFEPVLDEYFGITHTKQQVRPTSALMEIIGRDMEEAARALNARVRKAHADIKTRAFSAESERRAAEREGKLTPLPRASQSQVQEFEDLLDRNRELRRWQDETPAEPFRFAIKAARGQTSDFYEVHRSNDSIVVLLNRSHPFYKKVFAPLLDDEREITKTLRRHLEYILLAAARSEELIERRRRGPLDDFRGHWGSTLASYLKGD